MKWRQEDEEFKAVPSYTGGSAWTTRDSVLANQKLGWGNGSVGKTLAVPVWVPESSDP